MWICSRQHSSNSSEHHVACFRCKLPGEMLGSTTHSALAELLLLLQRGCISTWIKCFYPPLDRYVIIKWVYFKSLMQWKDITRLSLCILEHSCPQSATKKTFFCLILMSVTYWFVACYLAMKRGKLNKNNDTLAFSLTLRDLFSLTCPCLNWSFHLGTLLAPLRIGNYNLGMYTTAPHRTNTLSILVTWCRHRSTVRHPSLSSARSGTTPSDATAYSY